MFTWWLPPIVPKWQIHWTLRWPFRNRKCFTSAVQLAKQTIIRKGNVLISFDLVQSESMNNINLKLVDERKIVWCCLLAASISICRCREREREYVEYSHFAKWMAIISCSVVTRRSCQNICICPDENIRIWCVLRMQKICQPLTIPTVPLAFNGRMYSAQKATS